MEKPKRGFLECGECSCSLRRDFVVNAALASFLVIPAYFIFFQIFPEQLQSIDGRKIVFLLPALINPLFWALGAGCHLCLFSYVDSIMRKSS